MTALPLEPHTEAEEATLARSEAAEPTREDYAVAAGLVRRARAAEDYDAWDAARDAIAQEIASERAAAAADLRARIVNHAAAIAAPVAQAGEGR